jgi:hypothetical protein
MPATRSTTNPHPDPLETVVTTLAEVGLMTAGQLAEHLGIAYSTLTPRLRQLESVGRVQRVKDTATRQTLWRSIADHLSGDADQEPLRAVADDDGRDSHGPNAVCTRPVEHTDVQTGDSATMERREAEAETSGADADTADEDPDAVTPAASLGGTAADSAVTPTRRPKGSIADGILMVTRAQPDTAFKISQLAKALDGTSAGAIANSASKLVVSGELTLVCEKPATYQAT